MEALAFQKEKTMRIFLPLSLLLLTGCSSMSGLINKLNGKNHESAQVYVTGTSDTLQLITNRTQEIELAASLIQSAQEIEGLPPSGKRLNVKGLLNQDRESLDELADRRKADQTNQEALRKAEARLLELGSVKEQEQRQSLIGRLKLILGGILPLVLIVAGMIALCFICPPLIPVFGTILGMVGKVFAWLVSKIPGLVHSIGVVSATAFQNVVKGVNDARTEFKANPGKTYTGEEVMKILNDQLKFATDVSDKAIIENVKESL